MIDRTASRDVAIHFLKKSEQELSKENIRWTIGGVQRLMDKGYTELEIVKVIELLFTWNPKIYSFKYVETAIDKVIVEIRREEQAHKNKLEAEQIKAQQSTAKPVTKESEVANSDEATERNRRKAERLGIQPRERKKSYFDLFEG